MNNIDIITVLLTLLVCLLVTVGRSRVALALIVFLIPLSGRIIGYSVTFILPPIVAFISISQLKTRSMLRGAEVKGILWYIVAYLMSLVVLFTTPIPSILVVFGDDVVTSAVIYGSTFLAGIILYFIVLREVKQFEHAQMIVIAFCCSIFFLALTTFIAKQHIVSLPDFVQPEWVSAISRDSTEYVMAKDVANSANAGFVGYHRYMENFAEYAMVCVGFSLLLLMTIKDRYWKGFSLAALAISTMFGVMSGVKAFPILLILVLAFIAWFIPAREIRLVALAGIALILALSTIALVHQANIYVVRRASAELAQRIGSVGWALSVDGIETVLGRTGLITVLPLALETGGLFGAGPVIYWMIADSVMPFHNLYYQILLSMGFSGLIAFGYLVLSIFFRAWKNSRPLSNEVHVAMRLMLAIIAALLIEQFKVSAFRMAPGQITFWLLLGLTVAMNRISTVPKSANSKRRPLGKP